MRRAPWVIALPILTVIVVVLLLWALSPWWIEIVVRNEMIDRGFDDVSLDMGRPRPGGMQAESFAFVVGDGAVSVRLLGVEAGYRLTELFDGRLQSLTIEAARITWRGADAGPASPRARSAPLAPPLALPRIDVTPYLSMIPARGIEVSRVTVMGDTDYPPVSLRITRGDDGESVLAVVAALDPAADDRALEVVADRDGRISGALAWGDASLAPALEFSLAPSSGTDAWTGRLSGDASSVGEWLAPLAAVPVPLSACAVNASIRLADESANTMQLDADLRDCRVGALDFKSASVRSRLAFTPGGLSSVEPARVSLQAASGPGFDARSLVFESGVEADLAAGRVSLPAGARLTASGLASGDVSARNVSASLRDPLSVSMNAPQGVAVVDVADVTFAWRDDSATLSDIVVELPFGAGGVDLPVVRIAAAEVNTRQFQASASRIAARADGAAMRVEVPTAALNHPDASLTVQEASFTLPISSGDAGTLRATANRLLLDAADYRATLSGFAGRADWRADISAEFDARLAGAMPVNGRLEVAGDASSGTLLVEGTPVTLGEDVERASLLLDGWPAGIDLLTGRAGFEVNTRWDADGVRVDARVELDGAGGVADEVYFSDATTTLELEVYPRLRTTTPATVRVGAVDYGIALSDITGRVAIEGMDDGAPVVVASEVRADAFDGAVRVPRYVGAVGSRFDVLLEDIDLARLVGEDRFPGLSLSGRVDGRVPVEIRDDGLYINRGLVENTVDGVLHYDPGNVGAGSGAEILFKALKQFEYTVLKVEPEYRPDGTLILAIHMEGTSDEIGRTQPVHFNVNVEQNVLSLLKSIRVVNGLNERIDRSVQQYYQQRSQ